MLRARIIGLRLGAARQGNISQVLLKNFECVKPHDDLVSQFSERAEPLFWHSTLQRQIQNLHRTRDLLLPRLLSGQVELSTLGLSGLREGITSAN